MLDVACGIAPSASAALKAHRETMAVSRQAFYGKLQRMEPAVSAAVVRRVAELAERIIEQLGLAQAEPNPCGPSVQSVSTTLANRDALPAANPATP